MLLWAHIFYWFCFEGSTVRTLLSWTFPSHSEGWLTEDCSYIGCKFLTISTESSQTSLQKSATNPLSFPRNRIYETTAALTLTLFFSSCPSQHHLCVNPIISGLIAERLRRPFCSTFLLLSVLSPCFITSWSRCCGMMGPIFVFASHHCPSAPQPQYTSERTHAQRTCVHPSCGCR